MSPIYDKATIHKIITPFLKSCGVVRAGLFGSTARGEDKSDSDIDLLIDTDGKMTVFKIVGLKQDLEERLGRKVDIVEYDAIKPTMRESVMSSHEAIVL